MTLGRRVLILASALVLALGLPSLSRAQSLTGASRARSRTHRAACCPAPTSRSTNQSSKTVQRTVTNSEGVFVFASVPPRPTPCAWSCRASRRGKRTDIVMLLGQRRTVAAQITLKVGGVSETITVSAASRHAADQR